MLVLILPVHPAKFVQENRSQSTLGRAGTTSSASSASRVPPPSRAASSAAFKKSPPPPPPGASSHVDPPPSYTPSPHGNGAAAKRAPPPPPPLKPKPKPSVQHVVALYDFTAQVRLSFTADFTKVLHTPGGWRFVVQYR